MRRAALAFLALLAAVATASLGAASAPAGTSASSASYEQVFRTIAGLKGDARTKKLRELAAREGDKLVWYTSINSGIAADIATKFEKAYGIDVTIYRASDDDITQRVREETGAHYRGADLIESNGPQLVDLGKGTALVRYTSPQRARLVKASYFRMWTAHGFERIVPAWNTNLVPAKDRPRSWESLGSARFRGQLALEPGDYDWYATLWRWWVTTHRKTPAQADKAFAAMAKNGVTVKGHTLISQLVAAGEFKVAASMYPQLVDKLRGDDAPIAWQPAVQPVVMKPAGVALVQWARHPACSVLFYDWALGAGQPAFANSGYEAARRDLRKTSKFKEIVMDLQLLSVREKLWRDRYDRLLANAKPRGG